MARLRQLFWRSAGWAVILTLPAGAITVGQLQSSMTNGERIAIIDVRLPAQYTAGHIPGAINIPASVCPYKNLPPFGRTIIYDDGIRSGDAAKCSSALSRQLKAKVDVLNGGYAAWQSAHALTTGGVGLKPEKLNYISYRELAAAQASSVVLVDMRHADKGALTDLRGEFPGRRIAASAPASGSVLAILIDNGDGAAQAAARRLKAAGNYNYAILAGGELALARHGKRGSERLSSNYQMPVHPAPKQP